VSQASIPHEGMAKLAARSNRRATVRYRCAPATVGKLHATDDHEFQRAWILDLSLTGFGMQLGRPIELTHLVDLTIRANDGEKTFELSAQVIHCREVSPGEWYAGCEFLVPLSRDDLEQLL
jgi:PilZ domain